ncbi:hypothetical protein TG4357_03306 [Thalassovita gelatinovora]|uniref:Uncharacterized protein n=1 Tax=Thalassovita gelatinovora TaxID=53501 RepID=A0A0P1FJ07_THAGE|nr:hypothetical protein [Thalassovita gelatinovora]QIZ81552.1 hypothetical protein HFZ77_14225 [Thalassovita gelatinovora]CUH67958.1 hypothetical protein TG4357_03306 [Thalassovita gelatinovora]SEQ26280.1 hypothetical protein SAMN04488043_104177 [Thalassovita gelatinovora]
MKITLFPQRRDDSLSLSKTGDILTVNGTDFDFSTLTEGEVLPREDVACDWIASDVTRTGGVLHLALILPHGSDAPVETKFPAPLTITADGPITLPPPSAPDAAAT